MCRKSKVRVVSTVRLLEGYVCLTGNFLEKFSFIRGDPPRFDRFDRAGLKKKEGFRGGWLGGKGAREGGLEGRSIAGKLLSVERCYARVCSRRVSQPAP